MDDLTSETICIKFLKSKQYTDKLDDKERFDKEQISVKKPFPVTNCQFTL